MNFYIHQYLTYQGCLTGYGCYGFHRTRFFWSRWVSFIILFKIWNWVSSSILNSKFNSEAYFSYSSRFASIWCKGRKTATVDCHILLEHFFYGWCNAMTWYTILLCKSNVLFISVVCRRVSLSGEVRLIFKLIKYYLLLFSQHLCYWLIHFSHNFFTRS